MNKTPRSDDREFAAIYLKPSSRVVYASFARQLETELAKANELLLKTNQVHIENQQLRKDLDGEREINQRLTDEIIDARAEIERKDKLIEQMREALRAWTKTPDLPLHEAIKITNAALEAEERMGKRAR